MKTKTLVYFLLLCFFTSNSFANTPTSSGKYKNWESFTLVTDKGKVCFAQTKPVKRAPAAIKRNGSRIFVTFRPNENIKDEISITSGHTYKNSTVSAKSGKSNFSFFSQGNFAWLLDENEEKKFIKLMKRATDLMIKGKTKDGAETTDHYSMMGFTKAYNTAKKVCS
tara:strand:+ start:76 stop:576 length:501 start_codon:yes stop_codon:yes gene_type:complete